MHSRLLLLTLAAGCLSLPFASTLLAQGPSEAEFKKAMSMKLPEDPATVVAVVGEAQILLGEIKPKVDARINSVLAKTKQEIPAEQLHFARLNLTRQLLAIAIQNKMKRESFILDQVGTQDSEKRREASEMMSSRSRQMFYENEVPSLVEKLGLKDQIELDEALRKDGSSLLAREREFADMMLGHMYMRNAIEREPKVPLAEIVQAYREDRDKYKHSAKVRWEQLTVLFANHDRDEAKELIWEMGREAYFGGNMQAVAKAKSEEAFASDGGLHDWTNQGSLASTELDTQLFSLPLNAMSQVIEDETGYHIVRILERKPAGVTPLNEVQQDIEKQLQEKKVLAAQDETIKSMRGRVPVWSIFPDDIEGAMLLHEAPAIATAPNANNY